MSPDTIAAVATPGGVGAIGVIRVSGPRAFAVARALGGLGDGPVESRHALVRTLSLDGDVLDQALVLPFVGPASFTGEDVVELHCHGGDVTLRRVFEAVLAAGARVAEPGEFSRRALLNGKLDVVQVEAIADVIHAESEAAHRLAQSHLAGRLSAAIDALKEPLAELVVLVEAAIDFALEEHVYTISPEGIGARLTPIRTGIDALLGTYDAGRLRSEGVQVAIAGAPNAGKSTLLNTLLREDRAIVTEVPGTTRDTIEESIVVDGVRYHLVDTAGLRETTDRVEALGVARSRHAVTSADVVLFVAGLDGVEQAAQVESTLPAKPWGLVLNKVDLAAGEGAVAAAASAVAAGAPRPPTVTVTTSLLRGEGAEALEDGLRRLADGAGLRSGTESVLLSRVRHREQLEAAREALERASEASALALGHELVALDLRVALDALGALTGAVTSDDVLARIFGDFCIGK